MKSILLATKNEGKVIEIRESLSDLPIKFLSLTDISGITDHPEETGRSFEENALIKSAHYFRETRVTSIADDSGIIVHALQDELGIHTRRWGAGPHASDDEWITYFLERMQREPDRRATFVCVIVMIDEKGIRTFRGRCEGIITDTLESDYLPGLPISACFRPVGCSAVFSGLSLQEKNRVSHRGKAVEELKHHLKIYYTS